jgi:hypothetical protein
VPFVAEAKEFRISSRGTTTIECGPAAARMPFLELIASKDEVEGGNDSDGQPIGN